MNIPSAHIRSDLYRISYNGETYLIACGSSVEAREVAEDLWGEEVAWGKTGLRDYTVPGKANVEMAGEVLVYHERYGDD